jgi:hypothetical protein
MPTAARKAMFMNMEKEGQTYDYLLEREEPYGGIREGATRQLAGLYNLEGGTGSQQQLIDQARQSPFYGAMMEQGEDAIARNQVMLGGGRSGNIESDFADFSANTLLQSYNQQLAGLQGLSQIQPMPSMLAARLGSGQGIPDSMKQETGQGGNFGSVAGGAMAGVVSGMAGGAPGMIAGGIIGGLGGLF